MKKFKIKFISLGAFVILLSNSCTRDFTDYNSKYSESLGTEQLGADFVQIVNPFKQMQTNLGYSMHWMYQLSNNLNADMYSGYFSTATPFGGGRNNTTYFMMQGWNEWIMKNQLEEILQGNKKFKDLIAKNYPNIDFSQSLAIQNILKVISSQRTSDKHGPIIYSKFESPAANGITDFDSQQDAYNYFIKDLTAAIATLKKTSGVVDIAVIKKSDVVYNGNIANWARLANSLKLRIAMRMSYADPANAKKYAEEALADSAGLIDNSSESAYASYGGPSPLYDVIFSWNDCKSGASLLSYLKGYNDPRLIAFAQPAKDNAVAGQYIGIRQGIDLKGSKDTYGDYSTPIAMSAKGDLFSGSNGYQKIFTPAETWFLKAEASIRGYAGSGNAQSNYENGVKASLEEWGKSSSYAAYITNAVSTEAPYTDPKNSANNILAGNSQLSTITIAWNDADTFEKKLERIITQKWLALYPDGAEAWAEQRRTGYPKLFKNIINDSQGEIDTNIMIRRIPIPTAYRNNTLNYAQAVQMLGGADTAGTKLWWDKK